VAVGYGLLDWRQGGKVANLTNAYFDPVTGDGKGFFADTAKSAARIKRNSTLGTSYLEDAGFVKLREVQLGWEVPSRFANRVRAQSLNIAFVARNLHTWTDFPNYDPENAANAGNGGQGYDMGALPTLRSIGLNVTIVP